MAKKTTSVWIQQGTVFNPNIELKRKFQKYRAFCARKGRSIYITSGNDSDHMMGSMHFSDDAFALDEIDAAGPGGTFIDREHTAAHFRAELWQPHLLDRQFYQNWRDNGATDMAQRIQAEKRRLSQQSESQPLDEVLDRELTRIVSAAQRELTG